MLTDTLKLMAGSSIENATIESGTTLPTTGSSNVGELFFLTTGTVGLYVFNGTAWTILSGFSSSPTVTGRLQADAYSYTVTALGSVSGTQTLDLATASEWTLTLTAATTFAFTNTLAAGTSQVFLLRITNGGAFTITWPTSTKFAAGSAPTLTAVGTDLLGVKYDTTTSTYMVFVIGLNIH